MDITLYQKMYAIMCAAASDAVDLLSQKNSLQAQILLEQALLRAEELYLSYEETATDTATIAAIPIMHDICRAVPLLHIPP